MHRKIKQGMFLIASLLLTSVLTATGIVLIKITASGKQISDNSIQKTQLLTATTMSNSIISASIDNILKTNSTANIFLVDTSTGSRTIVKNPDPTITTINLCSLIFNKSTCDHLGTDSSNPITLVPAAQQHGNFSISQSGPTITTPAPNAYYNVVAQSLICGTSGSNIGCQQSDLRVTKKRSCPSSTNVPPKPMSAVAMLDTDVIPAGYNNKFPNLFCTCSDPIYNQTLSNGTCSYCPTHAICDSSGAITGCKDGYSGATCSIQCTGYITGSGTSAVCNTCPTHAACSNGAISACKDGYSGATCSTPCSGYVTGSGASAVCTTCPTHAVCFNSTISSCKDGYSDSTCSTPCSGYVTGSGTSAVCNACPTHAVCFNGTISSCKDGYSDSTCSTPCSGYITGSGTSAVCNPCPTHAVCVNGAISSCKDGYSGATCTSLCPNNSSLNGSGPTTNIGACKCNSTSYYWDGTQCSNCATGVTAGTCSTSNYTCVSNASMSNNVCSCNAGYNLSNNACCLSNETYINGICSCPSNLPYQDTVGHEYYNKNLCVATCNNSPQGNVLVYNNSCVGGCGTNQGYTTTTDQNGNTAYMCVTCPSGSSPDGVGANTNVTDCKCNSINDVFAYGMCLSCVTNNGTSGINYAGATTTATGGSTGWGGCYCPAGQIAFYGSCVTCPGGSSQSGDNCCITGSSSNGCGYNIPNSACKCNKATPYYINGVCTACIAPAVPGTGWCGYPACPQGQYKPFGCVPIPADNFSSCN